jgi:hypothetical protein
VFSAAKRAAGTALVAQRAHKAMTAAGTKGRFRIRDKRTDPPREIGLVMAKRWGALSAAMLPQR